jgi:hypothetical protein
MRALQSTETSGNVKQMTQYHIPEDLFLEGKRTDMKEKRHANYNENNHVMEKKEPTRCSLVEVY